MASPQIDVDEIVATLEDIRQRGHSAHTVFRDWANLMLFALQDRDDPYLEIVNDYRERGDMDYPDGQRSVNLFAEAFGQHFTPHNVCETMAEIAGVGDGSDTNDRQTVCDPACGSGRTLLVAGRKQPDALFVGQDKDPLCAQMTALNCCFLNLDAYVIQGDSLTVEFQRAWQTSYSSLGGSVQELDDEEVEELHEWVTDASENTVEAENRSSPAQGTDTGSEDRTPPATVSVQSEQASLGAFEGSD
ncbi:N-6 DNA methylase [Haloarcula marismortui]|uniref:SAM-dependent DNA methyltransferase n=1 Tax=Haloarcula marismortui ATCC 33800 TaxID=662476 RepID=M0JM13_9EURY|nr:N-6 DNA methylase [Haloarcula sinaiiensis]EMA10026.1 Type I restriction-modification system methyltransferase subunit-like protein [Haloarcula sinaiiensis ATCC 33800]QUJ74949.1 SAM-dependent DNA methyltransferase [Haloarcula sinaiiensis ATCC 33800]